MGSRWWQTFATHTHTPPPGSFRSGLVFVGWGKRRKGNGREWRETREHGTLDHTRKPWWWAKPKLQVSKCTHNLGNKAKKSKNPDTTKTHFAQSHRKSAIFCQTVSLSQALPSKMIWFVTVSGWKEKRNKRAREAGAGWFCLPLAERERTQSREPAQVLWKPNNHHLSYKVIRMAQKRKAVFIENSSNTELQSAEQHKKATAKWQEFDFLLFS